MYNVLFENSSGQLKIIGTVENEGAASKVIKDFLKEHNYKTYYSDCWEKDNETTVIIDVGNHTEFFYIQEV